jgi:hypothetical protein
MDEPLRNQLWNLLDIHYWILMRGYEWIIQNPFFNNLFRAMWHNYFKKPLDTMPSRWEELDKWTREYFFNCSWNEVYEFLEVVVHYYNGGESSSLNEEFQKACNVTFERELSAYRFVNGQIVEITSKEEISEIEEAMDSKINTVNAHFENALKLLSDRKNPDYRNSIKESISAVEAICKLLAKNEKTTLGNALSIIEREGKIELHPSLKSAFSSLYSYTSDADGIRHSLKDEKVNADFEEAKFMLVTCSAFVNYLISKASKAGIKF